MEERKLRSYAREAFMQMERDSQHVSLEQAAALARGEISEPRRAEIAAHLAECEPCRQRAAEFQEFLADSSAAPAGDLEAEWQSLWSRIRRRQMMTWAARWSAVAAGVLFAVGLAYGAYWILSPSPQRLLAQAYREQRAFDLRLAGAGYAPIAPMQRGSGSVFSYPHSLLKAQERLSDQLKSRPDDPELLRLRGEAEMLARQAPAAVDTLEKARDLSSEQNAQTAQILADLGVAYALRAEVERRFGDYTNALEYLSRSIRLQPRSAETMFNRALVLERMMLYPEAVEEWKKYLQLDSTSDWAKEARQHLAEMEKKLKTRLDGLHSISKDPAKFLELAAAGKPLDAEAYLRDVAVTDWLPRSDEPARQAVAKLAEMLRRDHGDSWLAEMAATPRSAGFQAGLEKLAAARAANQFLDATHNATGLQTSREAQRVLREAGSRPGAMWAGFEEVYSLHELVRSEECYGAAKRLEAQLNGRAYPWLRARNLIEFGVGAMRTGRMGEAAALFRQAETMGREAGLGDTALRAGGMYLGDLSWIGLPSENLAGAEQTLRTFWSGTYSSIRFFRVVGPLREIAQNEDQSQAAYFLARSALWAAHESSSQDLEASARASLAAAAQTAGEEDEARDILSDQDRLFPRASPGYLLQAGVSLANVELKRHQAAPALSRLEKLDASRDRPAQILDEVRYYSALGEALRLTGQAQAAKEAFGKSIERGRGEIESLPSERERAGLLHTIEASYSGLVALELARPAGGAEALRVWRGFRALDAVGDPSPTVRTSGTVLTLADMPEGIVGWLTREDQVTTRRLEVSRETLATVAGRFRRECSDPAISQALLQRDALQIYRWIVEPFGTELSGEIHSLMLELDGTLAGIPVQALIAGDGRYFGDRFSLLLSSGYTTAARAVAIGRNAKALIIANPAVGGESASRFPPLPDSLWEAQAVRLAFPDSTVLEGRAATITALTSGLSNAEIVHFSGHGYANANSGALLFAPMEPRDADYDLLRSADLLRQDWSHCRLAVLSACAAAAGETHGAHNPESLVRALTRAGASRVLASLWSVDSAATSELMRGFYAALARGESPADALRAGQQSVRRRPEWDHPYYWAGFQLYGTT